MAIEKFLDIRFQSKTLQLIEQANEIIAEYAGITMNLRQVFYQFVARNLIPNDKKNYVNLGQTVVRNGRRAGLIDWDSIEDRTRNLHSPLTFAHPGERLRLAADNYKEDLWLGQEYRPEVWVEKEALIGTVEGVCKEFRVPYFANRGNNSDSEMYAAGKRFEDYAGDGLTPIVFYLGDHDPTGVRITEDIEARLEMFAGQKVEVRRLGLNFDQCRRYRLPPNYAKEADNNFQWYVDQFGTQCWELDALPPSVMTDLVRRALEKLINERKWNAALAKETKNKKLMQKLGNKDNWTKLMQALK
jgi:hypothetical protein